MTVDQTLTKWRAHAIRGELTEGLITAVGALLDEHPAVCALADSDCVCTGANWGEMAHLYRRITE